CFMRQLEAVGCAQQLLFSKRRGDDLQSDRQALGILPAGD
ncbi:MAG: hypothetical protein AMXMBFR75_13300, partial [Candidatus Hinthialibacteria bacterium]